MSGTGIPDFLAPTRLTPVAADQAIGTAADGSSIMPSMYFSQMIQRILSYLGQPASSVDGQTLTDQVIAVATIANTALSVASSAQSSAASAISLTAALQMAVAQAGSTPRAVVDRLVAEVLKLVLPLTAPSQSGGAGPTPAPAGGVGNVSGAVAAPSIAFPSAPSPAAALPLLPPAPGLGLPVVMAIRYFGF